jgi:AhpD family alkylhydroperoxidase
MTLDDRTTELIAAGASVTAGCLSCLESHVARAVEHGVDREEIAQAIEVGKMVRRGAAARMDRRIASLDQAAPAPASGAPAGCCG